MARIPMVTRTIKTTSGKALCVDTVNRSTFLKEFILPRTYKSDEQMMKEIAKYLEENIKVVGIDSSEVNEALYGMTEQEFINAGHILPAREVANKEAE